MFSVLECNGTNINQESSDDMHEDLRLPSNDYNWALICFLPFELLTQLISKNLGADAWISIQLCLWCIVSISISRCSHSSNSAGARAVRFALISMFSRQMLLSHHMVTGITIVHYTTEVLAGLSGSPVL